MDIRFFQTGVISQDFLDGAASGEQIQDERYPDPVPPDTRFPKAPLRVDPDARQQLLSSQGFFHSVNLTEESPASKSWPIG